MEATRNRVATPSDSLYRAWFQTCPDGLLLLDGETGRIHEANPAAARLLACEQEGLSGRNLWEVGLFPDASAGLTALARVREPGGRYCEEVPRRNETARWLELELLEVPSAALRGKWVYGAVRDLTARKRGEAVLREVSQDLQKQIRERTVELSAANRALELEIGERKRAQQAHLDALRRLVEAQEIERRRVSRELHDQMGQELTALKLGLKVFRSQETGGDFLHACVDRLDKLADSLMRSVHRLAWELRPLVLDDFGLELALERYLKNWTEQTGVPVDFHRQGAASPRLSPDLETMLYRVTQEAFTNISRHARASRVSVLLERRAGLVSLILEDNGIGFDVHAALTHAGAEDKIGLLGMRERVILAGGTIEIESTPGTGTTIFVRAPVSVELPA